MGDPTFIDTWVCMLRAGTYEVSHQPAFSFDESAIDSMVEQFNGPMPIDVGFSSQMSPELWSRPQPHTGSMLMSVEKRRDVHGVYLAGHIQTPHVTVAVSMVPFDPTTGVRRGPRLSGVVYTHTPLLPVESATGPNASASSEVR